MEQEELFELQDKMENASEDERMAKVLEFFPNFKVRTSKIGLSPKGANKYRVTLQNGAESYTTTFTDSIYNTCNHTPSHKIDMLYCIVMDAQCYESTVSFHDFCCEFGYDEYDERKKAEKCYEGCRKALEGIERLIGCEGYEVLSAITYGL